MCLHNRTIFSVHTYLENYLDECVILMTYFSVVVAGWATTNSWHFHKRFMHIGNVIKPLNFNNKSKKHVTTRRYNYDPPIFLSLGNFGHKYKTAQYDDQCIKLKIAPSLFISNVTYL